PVRAEPLEQAVGHVGHADPHVLAEHAHPLVGGQLVAERAAERLEVGQDRHQATPGRARSPLAYRWSSAPAGSVWSLASANRTASSSTASTATSIRVRSSGSRRAPW